MKSIFEILLFLLFITLIECDDHLTSIPQYTITNSVNSPFSYKIDHNERDNRIKPENNSPPQYFYKNINDVSEPRIINQNIYMNNLSFLQQKNQDFIYNPFNNGFNKFQSFSSEPPEFFQNSARLDYNLIKKGLERSRIMSQNINFLKRSRGLTGNTNCAKCQGMVKS
jgi:hypothetical protein